MKSQNKIIALIAAIVVLGVAAWQFPIAEWLTSLIQWIDANKEIAWIVFIVAYVFATVLMLPGSILTLAAGYLFGVLYGTALVSVSSVLGATAAFLVGRSLGRGWVREKIGKESEELELPTSGSTADALIDWLTLLGEGYAFLTEQKLVVRVAVDQQLISLHDEIGDASEIAIFPPMTGG